MHQLDGAIIADIVEAMRCHAARGVGMGAVPIGIGLGDGRHEAFDRFHDIVDIGEIAAHFAVVEQRDRFALQDRIGKEPHRHIGAAPGAVDGEKPQAGGWQAEHVGVGMRHQFIGLLGGSIKRERVIDVLVDRERHGGVRAIDGRG